MDLYDEFGNFIGGGDEGDYATGQDVSSEEDVDINQMEADIHDDRGGHQQIVLNEDKQYYLTAHELYGHDVETLVEEEDTQLLSEPIIAPIKKLKYEAGSEQQHHMQPHYSKEFMVELMEAGERVRNVAIMGHLHHGKTSLLDLLFSFTHFPFKIPEGSMPLYMDKYLLEQERKITLKSKPATVLVPSSQGTSYVLNCIDTPGHADFMDEVYSAARICDGIVLMVDCAEGLLSQTEESIKCSLSHSLPLIIILNKIERLFLELKLPPADAYNKLHHVIEEINTCISKHGGDERLHVSPEKGNVLFASTLSGWIFSLPSISSISLHRILKSSFVDAAKSAAFSKRLWGNVYYDASTGKFKTASSEGATKRTFVSFILEPLYKIYCNSLCDEREELDLVLNSIGVKLKSSEYGLNTKTVLRLVLGRFFGDSSVCALADAIVDFIPHPSVAAHNHYVRYIPRSIPDSFSNSLQKCSSDGPLVAFAVKSYPFGDASSFEVLIRVFSGRIAVGQTLKLLYSEMESPLTASVTSLFIGCGRYGIQVHSVPAGNWALVRGIDGIVEKSGTLVEASSSMSCPFKPIDYGNAALMYVAVEPVIPSELPKMLDGIRKLTRTYPLLRAVVEDSGEHLLLGCGELYFDCALSDLRRIYTDIEIKVSDPAVRVAETVAETSILKCVTRSNSNLSEVTVIAEPLERAVLEALQAGRLPSPQDADSDSRKELEHILRHDFGWDIKAARSVWAFGPDDRLGPNILMDDTLLNFGEDDERRVWREDYKRTFINGFKAVCETGVLCQERLYGVKFKIIEASLDYSRPTQMITLSMQACRKAVLLAGPKLMEPVERVEIITQNEWVEAVYNVLAKRRGHVVYDVPKAATPLYIIHAYLPLMDSFGFETDIRIHTHGMAYCQSRFDHWQVVPGDPLDRSIKLIPLEPSPAPHLARDYFVKTRRRKGCSDDIDFTHFFDGETLAWLAEEEAIAGIGEISIS